MSKCKNCGYMNKGNYKNFICAKCDYVNEDVPVVEVDSMKQVLKKMGEF